MNNVNDANQESEGLAPKSNVLITFLKPDLKGGGQRSTMLIVENIDRSQFNPIAVVPKEGEIAQRCEKLGIKYELLDLPSLRPWKIFAIIKALRKIKGILKAYNIDIIHTDSTRYSLYFGIVSRLLKIPLISHIRVSTSEPILVEYLLYSLSTKLIAVSKATAQRFVKFRGFDRKVEVVYNAVDIDEFNPSKRQGKLRQLLNIKDELLIGIIGELTPWKGQDDFIRAAKLVTERLRDVVFVIIGSGKEDYKRYLVKLVEETDLRENVIFLEFMNRISEFLPDLDILVNASKFVKGDGGPEGFSRIIIEAMAAGVAVIASDSGGNREAVDDIGLLFPPADVEKLAECIYELATDREKREKISAALRTRCEKCFTKERYVREIEKIYVAL